MSRQFFHVTRIHPHCALVKVSGKFTEDDPPAIASSLVSAPAGRPSDVLLDLTEFSGCDVYGLAYRVGLQSPATLDGGRIAIVCGSIAQRVMVEATVPWFSHRVRVFGSEELSRALDWLCHDSVRETAVLH